jgi:hypothetical protein
MVKDPGCHMDTVQDQDQAQVQVLHLEAGIIRRHSVVAVEEEVIEEGTTSSGRFSVSVHHSLSHS